MVFRSEDRERQRAARDSKDAITRTVQQCERWYVGKTCRLPTMPGVFPLPGDVAAGQAIAACGGDARETVKILIVANNCSRSSSTG
jgi:hypothetical protein